MSKEKPVVAVMIPVYNGERTLPLAVESLLAQCYSNWKAVIVNDGSTDGTREYLNQLNDSRFKIVHFEENLGRPYARNAALEICQKYPLIAFLDADDFYHPEKLKRQVNYLKKHPNVDLVSCGMGSFREGRSLLRVRGVQNLKVESYHYCRELHVPRAASLIRGSNIGALRFNEKLGMAQDSDFFMHFAHGRSYAVISEVLYYYSEFDSVSKTKILKSHGYNLLRYSLSLPRFPLASAWHLGKSAAKLGLYSLRMPFLSIERILEGRGGLPTQEQIKEYQVARKRINF